MKTKIIFLILTGIFIGITFSVLAQNITWWSPSNYFIGAGNDKTPEVQIWCELRVNRNGWENYCRWTGKYWELTCLGMERFFGERIEPIDGDYGCNDFYHQSLK